MVRRKGFFLRLDVKIMDSGVQSSVHEKYQHPVIFLKFNLKI